MKKPLMMSLSCAILLNSAISFAETEKEGVLGYVNDKEITRSDYNEYLKLRTHQNKAPAPDALMEEIITRELLFQAGIKNKLDKAPEFLEKMETFRYNLLAENAHTAHENSLSFTDEDLKAEYDRIITNVERPDEYKARHILVDKEDEAKAILAELKDGKDFAALAKEKSKDTGSGANGGDLGDWFTARQMVKPFGDALSTLKKGEPSAPVKTNFGWHIIILDDSRQAEAPAFEAVKSKLEQRLKIQAMQKYIVDLTAQAKVKTTEAFDALKAAEGQLSQ